MSNLKKWLEIKKQSRSFLIEMQKQLDTVDFEIEKSIRQTLNSLNTTDPDIILSHFPNNSYFQNLVSRYKDLLKNQQQELKVKAKMEWDLHSELLSKFLSHLLKTRNRQYIVRESDTHQQGLLSHSNTISLMLSIPSTLNFSLAESAIQPPISSSLNFGNPLHLI
jgi:hypothetical protein